MLINEFRDDPVLQVYSQEPWTSSKYPHKGPPILDTLLIKISTQNFQDMILGVYQVHPQHHGWPCNPGLLSGTVNILQVPPSWPPVLLLRFLKNAYISAKNKDNDTKLSGYDPWGLPRSSMTSRLTPSSKSQIRNHQRPSSTSVLDPPFLTHF